jgi:hypothetical protein
MPSSKSKAAARLAKFLKDSAIKQRVYHGTDKDFSVFKTGKHEPGSFFTTDPLPTEPYSIGLGKENGRTVPAYLSIKKPYQMSKEELQSLQLDQESILGGMKGYVKELEKEGYDGLHVLADKYDGGPKWDEKYHDVWVSFKPTQVKSAIGNRGTFDPTDPDITKAEGGKINPIKTPRQMLFEMSGILPGYANLGKVEKIGPDIYKKITKAISDYTRKTGSAPSPEDVKSLHEYARSLSKKGWKPEHDPETQARATHALATDPNLRATSPVVDERGITRNFNPETSPDEFLSRAMLGRGARGTMLRPKTMEISDPNVVESIESAQSAGRLDDMYPSQSVTPASDAIARTATGLENAELASGKVPMIDQIKIEFFQKNKRYPSDEELEMLISAYNPLRHQYGEKGVSVIGERPYTAKGMQAWKESARNEGIPEYAIRAQRENYPQYLKDELMLQQEEIPTLRPQKYDVGGMVLSPYEMQAEMITRGGEPSRLSMKDYLRAAKKSAGRAMDKIGSSKAARFGTKVLERAMPPVGAAMTAMSAHDTGKRLAKGDYRGAAMSGAMTALDAASMAPVVGMIPGAASMGIGALQELMDEREAKHRPQYEYSEDQATPGYRSVMEGYK